MPFSGHPDTVKPGGGLSAPSLRAGSYPVTIRLRSVCGGEGDVCAFELLSHTSPITVESAIGRMMAIAPGDAFLGTPGYREARRWAVGTIPEGGLIPGNDSTPIGMWRRG